MTPYQEPKREKKVKKPVICPSCGHELTEAELNG